MSDIKHSAKPVSSDIEMGHASRREHKELKTKKSDSKDDSRSIDKKDIETQVIRLHNEGKSQSQIGAILKSEYNIKSLKRVTGKTVLDMLKEHKVTPEIPEDLSFLLRRAVSLLRHIKENNGDTSAKRGYQLTVSKIRSLSKYYREIGYLPKDWVYSDDKAALLVK